MDASERPTATEYRVVPWPAEEGRPTERRLTDRLAAEGLHPYMWSNAPGDTYSAHSHDYSKVIYCVRGSITFHLLNLGATSTREAVTITPGDRLELAPGVIHDALVGPAGVVCLEAHRP